MATIVVAAPATTHSAPRRGSYSRSCHTRRRYSRQLSLTLPMRTMVSATADASTGDNLARWTMVSWMAAG
jgi:hypothetical protein